MSAADHQKGKFLWGWEPEVKSFRPETFMSIVRWRLVNQLGCRHTYGFVTKSRRIALKLQKSHANDAFCIVGGTDQKRVASLKLEQVRRNDRALQRFYDGKYVDRRTGETVAAGDLNCGRRTATGIWTPRNLRKYRGAKVAGGRVSVRRRRYPLRPRDLVLVDRRVHEVQGVQNKGACVKLRERSKPVRGDMVRIYRYGRGFRAV